MPCSPSITGADERGEAVEDGVGVGAAQVVELDVLGQHVPGEVDRADAQVVDVDLHADARDGPPRGGQRDGRAAGALRLRRVELAHEAGLDEVVDEAGDGRARQALGRGELGARRRLRGVDDAPQRDPEVLVAHLRLPGHARRVAGLGRRHALDPTGFPG